MSDKRNHARQAVIADLKSWATAEMNATSATDSASAVDGNEFPSTISTTAPTYSNDFPRELNRHIRYISSWASNTVTLDVGSPKMLGVRYRTFDIEKLTLNCDDKMGGIYCGPTPITKFPHLVDALKRFLNIACETHHHSDLAFIIGPLLRNALNIFSWMVSRGIYWLRDLEKSDTEQILDEVATLSWAGINQLEKKLKHVVQKLDANPSLISNFVGRGEGEYSSLNFEGLEQELGMPIGPQTIPLWFRKEIATRAGDTRPLPMTSRGTTPSHKEASTTASNINRLANPRGEIDGLQFKAFPVVDKAVKSRIKQSTQQTQNITPTDTVRVIRESLAWLFDYGPLIADALQEVRHVLDREAFSEVSSSADTRVRKAIRMHIDALIESGKIPGDGPGLEERDYVAYVSLTMISCGHLIGINHARRAKEIYGSARLPYGAYFGCVRLIDSELRAYTSEFWVSKGHQTWKSFPANGLVADAITLLERFYRIFQNDSTADLSDCDVARRREMKLFFRRNMTVAGVRQKTAAGLAHVEYSRYLFARAGLDPAKWNGSASPFRRMYVQLNLRRYDMPELPAVAQQLGHQGYPQLLHYGTDKHERKPGESIIEIHPTHLEKDTQDLLKGLREEGTTYLAELIENLFKGKISGGMFPRRVIKLSQRLSSIADFSKLSIERKSYVLAERLEKQGYQIASMPHVVCTAGSAKQTASSANCAKNGMIQRQDASPAVCSGCFHSWTTGNYQNNILSEAAKMRSEAGLDTTPTAVARDLKTQAELYEQLYEKDRAISLETQILIESYSKHINEDLGDTE